MKTFEMTVTLVYRLAIESDANIAPLRDEIEAEFRQHGINCKIPVSTTVTYESFPRVPNCRLCNYESGFDVRRCADCREAVAVGRRSLKTVSK